MFVCSIQQLFLRVIECVTIYFCILHAMAVILCISFSKYRRNQYFYCSPRYLHLLMMMMNMNWIDIFGFHCFLHSQNRVVLFAESFVTFLPSIPVDRIDILVVAVGRRMLMRRTLFVSVMRRLQATTEIASEEPSSVSRELL